MIHPFRQLTEGGIVVELGHWSIDRGLSVHRRSKKLAYDDIRVRVKSRKMRKKPDVFLILAAILSVGMLVSNYTVSEVDPVEIAQTIAIR